MKVQFVSETQKEKKKADCTMTEELSTKYRKRFEGAASVTDTGILLLNSAAQTVLHMLGVTVENQWTQCGYNTVLCTTETKSSGFWTCTCISCIGDGMRCDGLQKLLKFLHFDVAKWGGGGKTY